MRFPPSADADKEPCHSPAVACGYGAVGSPPSSRRFGLFHQGIAVVALVRQQILGIQAFDQGRGLCAICGGTCRNKYSDWHTMRIHGQVYLAVEPPFVTPMSWLPPLAPAAWGCALIWLASIISHS